MKRISLAVALVCSLIASPAAAGEPTAGWASEYGPGSGVAMPFCTWSLRHSVGCGWVRIQSLQTGLVVVVPVVDWCYCLVPSSPHPRRLVDLQYGVRDALGLDPHDGLWQVSVERLGQGPPGDGVVFPDTATR